MLQHFCNTTQPLRELKVSNKTNTSINALPKIKLEVA